MRTVIETASLVRRGDMKASEALDETLAAIERHNPELNAFIHLDVERARASADRVDQTVARGEDPGPLAGVPFGVKDLDDCEGMPTTKGSLWFKGGAAAAADAIHVARFRGAGAVPVGKTAVPEFGTWAYTATRAWGVTRNPWDPSRTPGGSSGGSASAVSAGMVPFATASDGGGSTRTPAGFCGLVGHKPSFGRIPLPASSAVAQLGVVGALATTVGDAALLLDIASGPDHRDRRSLPAPPGRYTDAITELDVRGLRVGWSLDLGFAIVDPEVAAITHAAMEALVAAGEMRRVDVDASFADSLDIYSKLGDVDTWINLPDGLWPERGDELDPLLVAGYEKGDRLTVRKFAADVHPQERNRGAACLALRHRRRARHAHRGNSRVPGGRSDAQRDRRPSGASRHGGAVRDARQHLGRACHLGPRRHHRLGLACRPPRHRRPASG